MNVYETIQDRDGAQVVWRKIVGTDNWEPVGVAFKQFIFVKDPELWALLRTEEAAT